MCARHAGSYIADGYCDSTGNYNTLLCAWDGGDCCYSTCEPSTYDCTSDFCLNPAASDYINPVEGECYTEYPSYLGDGYCDGFGYVGYNTAACDWDYGDCCPDTCVQAVYTCGQGDDIFHCIDPDSQYYYPEGCHVVYDDYLSDGYCDSQSGSYNTLACAWDGGDCCIFTCSTAHLEPEETLYECGDGGYDCKDNATCPVNSAETLGNGVCQAFLGYNTKVCGWDGGDCCTSTCVGDCVGLSDLTCKDPVALGLAAPTQAALVFELVEPYSPTRDYSYYVNSVTTYVWVSVRVRVLRCVALLVRRSLPACLHVGLVVGESVRCAECSSVCARSDGASTCLSAEG